MREIPLTFKSEGQQIVGILHFPKIKKAPLVIMAHGWSGNRLGTWNVFFVRAAREFSKKNFAVLRFDFRGSGDSEGKFENQTTTSMLKDLDNVISQISKFPEIDKNKICLIGHSQGGYISTLQTIKDKRVKCLILWAGRVSDYEDFVGKPYVAEILRKNYLLIDDYKVGLKYLKDSKKYHLFKDLKKFKVFLGLIYGEADNIVPPSEGLRLYQKVKALKELKILKWLTHDFLGEENQKEVIKISLDWLNKYLK
ncbi:MAG: alpha/beta fold hydrolase [bacterium]